LRRREKKQLRLMEERSFLIRQGKWKAKKKRKKHQSG
jgi:hypothetical protein